MGSGRPPGNMPLVRQGSIYSLTFDEFQSTMGGIGKDFGSMNMDELLKNIWSAEEAQTMAAVAAATAPPISVQEGVVAGGYLQRQGSLTLPRTLSQKTVDEVWKDMSKEYGGGAKDGSGAGGSNLPQRQPTLGEMTLEEFLIYPAAATNSCNNCNSWQQRSSQQQLFPKQAPVTYTTPVSVQSNSQLCNPGIRNGMVGISDSGINGNLVQSSVLHGGGMGMVGLGAGGATIASGSPANQSSDGLGRVMGIHLPFHLFPMHLMEV
ncbi:Abscisic acid-insensitive 5-like protein 7 [Vitis vinifera]|uniref:Abscisic acid-insensitive 5-like protein 7 n=1 Tax=Vitis vinifera TaxID=29760 RepID=A0A438DYC3_VITVI|nr:Abscisic acid-insensitive 5-like protein 7 [Vitis vinifera]